MGLVDWLLGRDEYVIARPVASSEHLLQARLDAAIAARSMAIDSIQSPIDALSIPAVYRGVTLLSSMVGQFLLEAWRDDERVDPQPSLVVRPDGDLTRADFLGQLVVSLVAHGDAWLWPTGRDFDGWPTHCRLLDPTEVVLTWDLPRVAPVVTWRNTELTLGRDVYRVSIGRRTGVLEGLGPLQAGLPALQAVAAADAYAAAWYASGGLPPVVLRSAATISDLEAQTIKNAWVNAGVAGSPRVLGGGLEADFPGADPQAAQLLETRAEGSRMVARLLGIPAALLLIEQSGSNVTYTNVATLITELVRSTVAPMYLVPIEQTLSDMLPRGQSVRFALGELERASLQERVALYAAAIAAGVMSPEFAAEAEGWPAPPPPPPAPVAPATPGGTEVPANA